MAKIAPQLKAMIEDFVDSLAADVVRERVFLWGEHVSGKPSENSDIRLVVISPSFEGRTVTNGWRCWQSTPCWSTPSSRPGVILRKSC